MLYKLPVYVFICLFLTVLLEEISAFLLGVRKKEDFITIGLVNMMTNPLLVVCSTIVNSFFGVKARNISLLILEFLVVVIEGLLYRRTLERKKLNIFLFSFILNVCSYFGGCIIFLFLR